MALDEEREGFYGASVRWVLNKLCQLLETPWSNPVVYPPLQSSVWPEPCVESLGYSQTVLRLQFLLQS